MIRAPFALAALAATIALIDDAQALPDKFRGEYVCAATPNVPGLLTAPVDVLVDADKVQFARPLYNFEGSRVVGTELAAGRIETDGRVTLDSQWALAGSLANAHYSGTIGENGGTLVGSQVWSKDGESASRTCVVAVVPVPKHAPAGDGE